MSTEVETAVIGAGMAGLGAALELRARGRGVLVLEAADRAGGALQTETRDGFVYERGTSTLRVSARMHATLERAGAAGALQEANAESRARYLLSRDGLVPVPLGPAAFATTELLSAAGKRRLLKEPFVARGDGGGESVAEFVTRRLGAEALERLVAPFLVGVYAGDVRALGAEAVFPALVAYERRSGSIVTGALVRAVAGPRTAKAPAGSFSGVGGLSSLVDAIVGALGADAVRTGARVQSIEPNAEHVRLTVGSETVRAERVVVAVDAPSAGALLRPFAPEAAELCNAVAYAPMVTLALDVDPARAARQVEGLGFLVPAETGIDLLGGLFMNRLFPGRAPPGRELVTAMIGGARWPEAVEADDATLLAKACEGLDLALGTGDSPRAVAVNRWRRAIPQPRPGHLLRMRELRGALAGQPRLALAGGWLDGVAVARAMESGLDAARRILEAGC